MFIFKKSSHWIIFLKFGLPLQNEQFDLWTSQFRRPQKKLFRIISIFVSLCQSQKNVNFLPFLWSNNRLLWAKHCLYVVNQINSLYMVLHFDEITIACTKNCGTQTDARLSLHGTNSKLMWGRSEKHRLWKKKLRWKKEEETQCCAERPL